MYNKTFFLTLFFILVSISVQANLPESSPAGGNYLALDGKDDYAVLDYDKFGALFEDGTKDLTVEAWIYPTSEPDKDEMAIIFRQQIEFRLISYDNPSYQESKERIDWKKGDLLLFMSAYIKGLNNAVSATGSIDMTLPPYQWHHIVLQFQFPNTIWICDNQSKSVLQGGKIESDISKISQVWFFPDKSFVLGGYGGKIPIPESDGSYGSFAGYIDEVRISDIARYDIAEEHLIPQGRFETDANTIALWHFDESIGTETFKDSSNKKYHLTGMNGASVRGAFAVNSNGKLATTWSAIKVK